MKLKDKIHELELKILHLEDHWHDGDQVRWYGKEVNYNNNDTFTVNKIEGKGIYIRDNKNSRSIILPLSLYKAIAETIESL